MSKSTSVRSYIATLLISTALTGAAHAQTAPAQQPAGNPPAPQNNPAPQPRPAAPQANAQQNFGTVVVVEPARRGNVALAQPGLTASPTDYGAVLQKASQATRPANAANTEATTVTPGGVTRQDIGGGYMILEQATKTRSTVTRDAIDKQSVTSNPYQLINLLPGVIQSSTDNTGLNGGNIRLRGFNSDHLGLTIEGMPVNDSGNYALFPQEYVDAENIAQISIAQGVQDLDSPHIGATGGVINIYMRDPAKTAGGMADFSIGSNNLYREFVRVESGEIDGVSAYVSYSNLQKDHWIGPGHDDRQHIDFKAKIELSPGNTIRLSAIYNEALNNFYVAPTKAQAANFSANQFLTTLPSSFFTPNASGVLDQNAGSAFNYFGYKINPFKNLILSAPSNFTITPNLKFDTIPYYWYGFGNGGGEFTLSEGNFGGAGKGGFFWGNLKVTGVDLNHNGTTNDRIAFYNPSITETDRPGIINKFTYTAGDHEIVAGHWFEYALHKQTGPFEALNPDGSVSDPFAQSNLLTLPASAVCQTFDPATKTTGAQVTCPTGPVQFRDSLTTTMTNAFFVGDTWKATDKLSLIYGVKEVLLQRDIQNYLPGQPDLNLYDTATLPTIGARYKLDRNNTFFASYGTSFRSAPNFTLIPTLSSSTGLITSPITNVKPESGQNFEIGHRYQGSLFATSVSGFMGFYENFQQRTNFIDQNGSSVASTINVGGLANAGINAEFGTRPIYNFRPYVSAELLHTEMLDNLATTSSLGGKTINDFLATKGKELPGAPGYSYGLGLDYDDGHIFGNLAYKRVGPQYSTFMDDEQIKAYGRMDAAIGYRFADFGFMKAPEIKLQVFNLFDNQKDLTGVFTIQNNAQKITGINGGTINGSAPTYFLGADRSVLLTFKTGF
jgi:iron complex outermembrane receptor protein